MIDRGDRARLGGGIASVLRIGTLIAIAAIGLGYLALLATGEDPGSPSLLDLFRGGGAAALVGLGLFGLTLIPAMVLVVSAVGFRRLGEERLVAVTVVVLVLLLASLATAAWLALG